MGEDKKGDDQKKKKKSRTKDGIHTPCPSLDKMVESVTRATTGMTFVFVKNRFWLPWLLNPFLGLQSRCGEQTTKILSNLSRKRDCSPKRG